MKNKNEIELLKKCFRRIPTGKNRSELLHNKIDVYATSALEDIQDGGDIQEIFENMKQQLHEGAQHYVEMTELIYNRTANKAPKG